MSKCLPYSRNRKSKVVSARGILGLFFVASIEMNRKLNRAVAESARGSSSAAQCHEAGRAARSHADLEHDRLALSELRIKCKCRQPFDQLLRHLTNSIFDSTNLSNVSTEHLSNIRQHLILNLANIGAFFVNILKFVDHIFNIHEK